MRVRPSSHRIMISAVACACSFVLAAPGAYARPARAGSPSVVTFIFTPDSIDTAGKVSRAFGPARYIEVGDYEPFGVELSTDVPTAIFRHGALAFGGVNAAGVVDLLAPVDGRIVIPGSNGQPGRVSHLSIEAGFSDVGNLLLETFDCAGRPLASTVNDDGIGPTGRTLMTLSVDGMSSFRVSTPAGDTFGVDSIGLDTRSPCSPPMKDSCTNGGWRDYVDDEGRPFRNLGQCVGWVVSHRS
jgi:hypothetical protein